jgi:2-polyprenyl-3-methyl-5-hydroxy-6-metoxy-1,4-benzoquinol methylase
MMDAKSAYDQWHAGLDVDVQANDPWHALVRRYLRPLDDIAGRRILEIGCGRGGFSCWIARQAEPQEQVAIDFSDTAVAKARAHASQAGLHAIHWETGDIQAIARPDASFDTVVSCETIEHVPDPRRAVRELARVLRRGGRLFLTTPNYLGPLGLYRGYLRLRGRRYTEEGQPINQFTILPRTMSWVKEAGLRVIVVDATGHYLPFPRRTPIRLETLDRLGKLTRWFALHSLVVAEKI